jgi:hypothetical protein
MSKTGVIILTIRGGLSLLGTIAIGSFVYRAYQYPARRTQEALEGKPFVFELNSRRVEQLSNTADVQRK